MTKDEIRETFDALIADTNTNFVSVHGEMSDVWTAIQGLTAKCAALEQQVTQMKDVPTANPKTDGWGYYVN